MRPAPAAPEQLAPATRAHGQRQDDAPESHRIFLTPWSNAWKVAIARSWRSARPFDPVKAARTALYVREVRGRFGGGGGWTCADLSGLY